MRVRTPELSHWSERGRIVQSVAPRSYIVETDRGHLRCNRRHLMRTSEEFSPCAQRRLHDEDWLDESEVHADDNTHEPQMLRRSNRVTKKPSQLIETI